MTSATDQPQDAALRPRVRSGAMVWGAIVTAVAVTMLAVLTSPGRRQAALDWLTTLTPFSIAVILVVALGAVILIVASLAVIRRAQRQAAQRRSGQRE